MTKAFLYIAGLLAGVSICLIIAPDITPIEIDVPTIITLNFVAMVATLIAAGVE